MSKQTSFQAIVRKHKMGAMVMGVCLALIILLHLWQEGFDSLLPALQRGLR